MQLKPFAKIGTRGLLGLIILNEIRGALVVATVVWSWLQHSH